MRAFVRLASSSVARPHVLSVEKQGGQDTIRHARATFELQYRPRLDKLINLAVPGCVLEEMCMLRKVVEPSGPDEVLVDGRALGWVDSIQCHVL
jgi:hypothetical protein